MPSARPYPLPRADWLAARALLASQRLRSFIPVGLGVFVLVFSTAYAVRGPIANRTATTQRATERAVATGRDTLSLTMAVQAAQLAFDKRDSTWRELRLRVNVHTAAPALSLDLRRRRDSLHIVLGQLEGALDRAARAPLSASYRTLANTSALRALAPVQALIDTLDLLDRARQVLDPIEAPQREFAQFSQRANAVGGTLQRIGQSQRAMLLRQIAAIDANGNDTTRGSASLPDTAFAHMVRDSAQREVTHAESLLQDARQRYIDAQRLADSIRRAYTARILGASPFIAATSALVMMLALSFTLAVLAEVRSPTIAHAREIEHLTGLPVLATAHNFRMPREGRARLQPGVGVDPFRMVYLALTASGTQMRTVCITGDDVQTATAVACRLAVSAAADERATLLLDLAPGVPAASAYFGWRHEPGFTEAIAGVRLWREVARPVGASEGVALDVIPAGSPREDTVSSVQDQAMHSDFLEFIADYDFTALVAPNLASTNLAALACIHPPAIVVVQTGKTQLDDMKSLVGQLKASKVSIHGFFLIDA